MKTSQILKIPSRNLSGGGIRGITTCVILKYIEEQIQRLDNPNAKIGDYFDLIAVTRAPESLLAALLLFPAGIAIFGRQTLANGETSQSCSLLELLSLGGELTAALKSRMKKAAKELLEIEDALRRLEETEVIEKLIEDLKRVAEYAPNQLMKKLIRSYKDVAYEISIYPRTMEWRFTNFPGSQVNRMDIDEYGYVAFNFRIPDELTKGGRGFEKLFLDETFEFYKSRINGASASWTESPAYPNGSSLEYKQFWKAFKDTGDKVEAVKQTTFYKQMSKHGISKIFESSITTDPIQMK